MGAGGEVPVTSRLWLESGANRVEEAMKLVAVAAVVLVAMGCAPPDDEPPTNTDVRPLAALGFDLRVVQPEGASLDPITLVRDPVDFADEVVADLVAKREVRLLDVRIEGWAGDDHAAFLLRARGHIAGEERQNYRTCWFSDAPCAPGPIEGPAWAFDMGPNGGLRMHIGHFAEQPVDVAEGTLVIETTEGRALVPVVVQPSGR